MTDLELYCYDIGEWVKITRTGINYDRTAVVVNRNHLSNPIPTNMYTVALIEDPDVEIILPEGSLRACASQPLKQNSCECGGDHLQVPHHYPWCPKGK